MNSEKAFFISEIFLIFIYTYLIFFALDLQPLNLILGFICVIILPGYNLISVLKPNFKIVEKLGYSIIVSLAIESVIMFFSYIFLYNFLTSPETRDYGFFYTQIVLIGSIQIVNIVLMLIILIKRCKFKNGVNPIKRKRRIKSNFKINKGKDLRITVLVFIVYFVMLFFLCISTFLSDVPNNEFNVNLRNYSSNFMFFNRVPLIFYFFLVSSIICLVFFIFYTKNPLLTTFLIATFMYVIWILPYLQIKNYFSHDANLLYNIYQGYFQWGIKTHASYNFVIHNVDSLRYSTSLFATILLTYSTNTDINFALWYLYPLMYIFIPFLFYSYFMKYTDKKHKINLKLIILTLFAFLTPQILKSGHAAGTGVLGIIVFYMLIMEFLNLINSKRFSFKISNFVLIFLLYFLLCLTHLEECIYYIVAIASYSFCFLFYKVNHSNFKAVSNERSLFLLKNDFNIIPHAINQYITQKDLKKFIIVIGWLLCILILIFYLVQEVFGWIDHYFLLAFSNIPLLSFIREFYLDTRVRLLFFMRGVIDINFVLIGFIILLTCIFIFCCYVFFFKCQHFIKKTYTIIVKLISKIFYYIRKLISNKIFQVAFVPLFLGMVIYVNLNYFARLEEFVLIEVIALILGYLIFAIQMFLFIKGILYYQIDNLKQNYYLFTIASSTIIMFVMFLTGGWFLSIYIFQSKFLTYLIFFNLLIIENTYFDELIKKKKGNLVIFILIFLLLAIFYSLRTLRYG